MKTKSVITTYVLLTCFIILTGCAIHQVCLDIAINVNNHKELLQLFGKPDSTRRIQNGFEKWTYHFKSYNIFRFEYTLTYYIYVLNQKGEVVEKNIQVVNSRRRLIPVRELPNEFNQFK